MDCKETDRKEQIATAAGCCCCGGGETKAGELFEAESAPCCASSDLRDRPVLDTSVSWVDGFVSTAVGNIPRVLSVIGVRDYVGACLRRWGIGRSAYRVPPGLYAVGSPSESSDVFVSANYKMSFDRLRRSLVGLDGWILVLDTKGINVWCAAGKGTFGTDEVVARVGATNLAGVVSHRRLIVPQLGAPGVSAHEVKKRTGFSVSYGPVRAEDIPAYLEAGCEASSDMRRVNFTFSDRLVLSPMELVMWAKWGVIILLVLLGLSGLGAGGYSFGRVWSVGGRSALLFLAAYVAGGFFMPVLLPWLPGRMFALKGYLTGLGTMGTLVVLDLLTSGRIFLNGLNFVAWLLIAGAVSSFIAMNFTGASTFTSLSGVRKEMRFFVPVQLGCAVLGLVLWCGSLFV